MTIRARLLLSFLALAAGAAAAVVVILLARSVLA
jgi:hypothetical protein